MTDQERIRALEAENERLRRIAGVRSLPDVGADLPNEEELEELRKIVLAAHPVALSCSIDQFALAMRWAAFTRRQSKLNSTYYLSFWMDQANAWLKKVGYDARVSLKAVVAACLASNVACSPLTRWPWDVEIGLGVGDVSKPSDAWRSVLAAGELPEPTPLNRQLVVQPTWIDPQRHS